MVRLAEAVRGFRVISVGVCLQCLVVLGGVVGVLCTFSRDSLAVPLRLAVLELRPAPRSLRTRLPTLLIASAVPQPACSRVSRS